MKKTIILIIAFLIVLSSLVFAADPFWIDGLEATAENGFSSKPCSTGVTIAQPFNVTVGKTLSAGENITIELYEHINSNLEAGDVVNISIHGATVTGAPNGIVYADQTYDGSFFPDASAWWGVNASLLVDVDMPIGGYVAIFMVTGGTHELVLYADETSPAYPYLPSFGLMTLATGCGYGVQTDYTDRVLLFRINGVPLDVAEVVTGTPDFVFPSPSDGAINNTNQTINMSCGVDDNMQYLLWWDTAADPILVALDNVTSQNWTTNVSDDDTYYYKGQCYNATSGIASDNSSVRSFILDTTTPTIIVNDNNFFNSSTNESTKNQYLNNITLNTSFLDNDNVFAIVYNITKDGVIYFNHSNSSINEVMHNYSTYLDIASWPSGVYDIEIIVADGHHYTGGYQIGDYDVTKLPDKLIFKTTEGNEIIVSSDYAYSTKYTRESNSYSFGFDYLFSDTTRKFTIESKDGSIFYVPKSKYNAHFVVWNGKHGNWIDFEGLEGDYTVKKISNNKYEITFTNLPSGKEVITRSIGGLNVKTENYQWYRGIYNVSAPETFSQSTTELILNITKNDTFITNISVTMSYNNTDQTFSQTSYEEYITYNVTITAPQVSVDTNIPYFWNVTINQTGNIYNFTISENNNILNWGLDNCTLYTNHAINFTIQDEMNLSAVKSDVTGTFNYSIDQVRYFSYDLDVVDVYNFSICITPTNVTLHTDYTLAYSADSYPQRNFEKDNDILTNVTVNIPLYLLRDSLGLYQRFTVVDTYSNIIGSVTAKMERTVDGVTSTIEEKLTDDSGFVRFWANPDVSYIFTFSKIGYETESFTLTPDSSEIRVIILGGEAEEAFISTGTGIVYSFSPKNTVLTNDTVYDFMFNMTSSYFEITDCWLWIKNESEYLQLSNLSSDFDEDSCDITISYNTGNSSTLISEATYILNGTSRETVSLQYTILFTYEGDFSLKNFLDDLKDFGQLGFNDFTRMLIAFVVIFGIVASLSSRLGLKDPEVLVMFTWSLIFFFSYIGWLTLSLDTIPSNIPFASKVWLQQYIIFMVLTLGAGIYIIRRHTD